MTYYNRRSGAPLLAGGYPAPAPAYQELPFPDFGQLVIHRPSREAGGKEQEIKVSLLNSADVVDCVKDVPLEFGDVVEVAERNHLLGEGPPDPVQEMESKFSRVKNMANTLRLMQPVTNSADALVPRESSPALVRVLKESADAKAAAQRWACLQKSVQLVVGGATNQITLDSWKVGFLTQALNNSDARTVLRSSSDLSRVKVTRKDPKSGRSVVMILDATSNPERKEDLWLREGDVIEVPDKP